MGNRDDDGSGRYSKLKSMLDVVFFLFLLLMGWWTNFLTEVQIHICEFEISLFYLGQ